MVVKIAFLPWHQGRIFVPVSASGTENISVPLWETEAGHADAATEDYSAIIRRNIFGDTNSSPTANKSLWGSSTGGLLQPVEEELGLALVGTVSGSPAVSRAVIKDIQTNILGLYKTGQTVAGACVESIEKNAVILLHNGQRKTLTLKTGVVNRPAPSVMRDVSEDKEQDTQHALRNTHHVQAPAQIPAKIEQIESMLGKAVVEPYIVEGQAEGLKITGLEGISAAKNLGLKNGDIIRVVNGQQVTSKQKAYQIFRKARAQAFIDIELLRGNESQKLSFTLR
jgi:general secretion pathway protein C